MTQFAQHRRSHPGNHPRRSILRHLLASSILALSLGIPIVDNPLTLPVAHAHHGGGGSGSGSGGGKGDGINSTKPAVVIRPSPGNGQGKGGRGFEGLKP